MLVLDSALEIFLARGFKATSISQIATNAGVSTGLIYRFHASKKALYEAVLERVLKGWSEDVAAATQIDSPSGLARIRAIFDANLRYASDHPDYYELLNSRSVDLMSGWSGLLDDMDRSSRRQICRIVEYGIERGEIASTPPAHQIAGIISTLILSYIDRIFRATHLGKEFDWDEAAGALEVILKGIRK